MTVQNRKPKNRKIRIGRLLILLIPVLLAGGAVFGVIAMVSSIMHQNNGEAAVVSKKEERRVPLKRAAPEDTGRTVYLTFDDGCSGETDQILDTLDAYDAKATFFVINGQDNEKLKDIQARGHSIGLHSYSHKYDEIYASEDAYFSDLNKISDVVYEQTGLRPDIIRFPGGSSNGVSSFNPGIMTRLTQAVQDKGYQYFDWNVDSTDASGNGVPADQIVSNATNVIGLEDAIVLCHDTDMKPTTAQALPAIIDAYYDAGYVCKGLTKDSYPSHHTVNN